MGKSFIRALRAATAMSEVEEKTPGYLRTRLLTRYLRNYFLGLQGLTYEREYIRGFCVCTLARTAAMVALFSGRVGHGYGAN